MSSNGSRLVPEGAIHELLGVRRAPSAASVNVALLNAMGRKWVDLPDVLRWLRVNAETLSLPILKRLHDELAEATGTTTGD